MIPLLHDFTGETVLVFGGGSVGARKARKFTREARVVVVSPDFANADFGDVERVTETVDAGDVSAWFDEYDPALVVAATSDEAVNAAIAETAQDRGVLVNRTDVHGDRDPGSVVVPATVRDDPVVAAIATGGQSPALSRYLRERLESELESAGAMAELTGELRDELQKREVPADDRREAIRRVVRADDVWTHLDRGSTNARQVAESVISDVTGDLS